MNFQLTPQCRTALATLVSLVTIMTALVAGAVISMDTRIGQALVPVQQSIVRLEERAAADRAALDTFRRDTDSDIARVERGVQTGFAEIDAKLTWLMQQQGR